MYRAISREDYKILLELDKKVYPTDNLMTREVLDGWYNYNPDFGMIFEENGQARGMFAIIPLSKAGWEKLTSGQLEEAEMKDDLIFDPTVGKEIGLHVYHIERFDEKKEFYVEAFRALGEVLRKAASQARVLGLSGYTVTTKGISLFYNKLNMREREYVSEEHIVSRNDRLEVLDNPTREELKKRLDEGYVYHNRCKMLITLPREVSLVWELMGVREGGKLG